jgi:hypothetical protein
MAIMTITQSLTAYLNQWVKITSGERVKLTGGISLPVNPLATTNTGYFVFRCTECQDNWHVGHENFQGNVQDPAAITVPSVLSDWVKKHRHVCKKFIGKVNQANIGTCESCKWPFGAHEESWVVKIKSVGATGDPDNSQWGYGGDLPMKSGGQTETFMYGSEPSRPSLTSMTLKQFTGRKFRDPEPEDTCESLDTSTEKTSNQ